MSVELNLVDHGCEPVAGAAAGRIDELLAILSEFDGNSAGQRISHCPLLADWLEATVRKPLRSLLPAAASPIRAILFDKSPASNWALGWHQDRTICVKARRETPGFGPWTRKQGLIHVEPPFDVIERLVTLRIHLDPVDCDNAPLLVAVGSHRIGKVASDNADAIAQHHETIACLAERGDVWAYATSILHASERSRSAQRRRVL